MQKQNLRFRRIAPWLLTGSLIALSSHADELNKVVEKQQELQKKVSGPALSQKPDCPTDAKSTVSMKECVQALCPLDDKHINYEKMIIQVGEQATKNFDSHYAEIKDLLDSWAISKVKDLRLGFNGLERLIASDHLKVDPKFQPLHNLSLLMSYTGDAVFSSKSTAEHYIIDAGKAAEKHPELGKDDQVWLARALEGYYNLPETRLKMVMTAGAAGSGANILGMRYPGLSVKQALAKMADELDDASASIEKKSTELGIPSSIFLDIMVPKNMIEAARSGKIESEESLEEFLNKALGALSFVPMATHPEKYPWLSGRSSDSIAPLKLLLSNRVKQVQNYLLSNDFQDKFTGIWKTCAASYSMNAEALPTEKEVADAKKRADGVISAFQSRVFKKLSSHTASTLTDHFNQIQVFFPRSFASYRDDFISEFKNSTLASQSSYEFARTHPGDAGAQFQLFNVYMLLGSSWSSTSTLISNFSTCDRFQLKTVNDKAGQVENVFWSSWFSVKNPQFGNAVMAHELGHIMDWVLAHGDVSRESAEKYQAIQNCLKPKHPEAALDFTEQAITAEGESIEYDVGKYNEEDFADQIAAMVMPETNLGCLLISSKERGQPSVLNADPTDTHSSNVYRALFSEQVRKGKIPKVCQDALMSEKMSRDFSSCFK